MVDLIVTGSGFSTMMCGGADGPLGGGADAGLHVGTVETVWPRTRHAYAQARLAGRLTFHCSYTPLRLSELSGLVIVVCGRGSIYDEGNTRWRWSLNLGIEV